MKSYFKDWIPPGVYPEYPRGSGMTEGGLSDCPFCHIKEREQDRVLEEREHVFVILSDPRLVPGHTLVIPKRHVDRPSQMSDAERDELFRTLLEWQDRMIERYSKGCDIRQNCRPFQSQDWIKQNHVHFHLQPRELNDEIYERFQRHEREMFAPLPDEERERFTALLKGQKLLDTRR